jgi:uncharacterized protein (DUF1697 family)
MVRAYVAGIPNSAIPARPNLGVMTRYAVFLRGVNVGGVNLKMPQVAAALQDAGFGNVRTLLASGNVLLDSSSGAATVRKKVEAALRKVFGYDAWVLVYDVDSLEEINDGYPFEREVPDQQSYVTFVSDKAVFDELGELTKTPGPGERISAGDGVVYWQVAKGKTLDSTMGKTMGKKRYKSSTTTRNLRTLDKMLK